MRSVLVVSLFASACAHELPAPPSPLAPRERREEYFEAYRTYGELSGDPRRIRVAVDDGSDTATALDDAVLPYLSARVLYIGGGVMIVGGIAALFAGNLESDIGRGIIVSAAATEAVGIGAVTTGWVVDESAQALLRVAGQTFEDDLREKLALDEAAGLTSAPSPKRSLLVRARVDRAVVADAILFEDAAPLATFVDELQPERVADVGHLLASHGAVLFECFERSRVASMRMRIALGVVVESTALTPESECAARALSSAGTLHHDSFTLELTMRTPPSRG